MKLTGSHEYCWNVCSAKGSIQVFGYPGRHGHQYL